MSYKVGLFSRDERTFNLFRKSWVEAFKESNFEIKVFNRGFGIRKIISAALNFLIADVNCRIIFGTSEICLYTIFANKSDFFVFTGIGRLLQKEGAIKNIIRFLLRATYRNQRIIALNTYDCSFLEDIYSTKVTLINGEGYHFSTTFSQSPKKNDVVKIAYVGRMLKSKGVDKLINVFSQITNLSCQLHLIGDFDFGSADALSRNWLSSLGSTISQKIHFHGFLENPNVFLRDVDIFVSLSEREGLPFSVLDAIEAGCYIVLTPCPGNLSFSHLPGISYCYPESLKITLQSLIASPEKLRNFDAYHRLQVCIDDFGAQKIISDIVKLKF